MTGDERLVFLADALDADADNKKGIKFDLGSWMRDSGGPGRSFLTQDSRERKLDCGTAACAVGLACLLPEFQAEGLSASWNKGYSAIIPEYGSARGYMAAALFFGISVHQAEQLFAGCNYSVKVGAVAERAVASRIRQYLKAVAEYPNS